MQLRANSLHVVCPCCPRSAPSEKLAATAAGGPLGPQFAHRQDGPFATKACKSKTCRAQKPGKKGQATWSASGANRWHKMPAGRLTSRPVGQLTTSGRHVAGPMVNNAIQGAKDHQNKITDQHMHNPQTPDKH